MLREDSSISACPSVAFTRTGQEGRDSGWILCLKIKAVYFPELLYSIYDWRKSRIKLIPSVPLQNSKYLLTVKEKPDRRIKTKEYKLPTVIARDKHLLKTREQDSTGSGVQILTKINMKRL